MAGRVGEPPLGGLSALGDDDQGEFLSRARQEGYKAVPFPKTYAQAFQAGDMAGWKCRIILGEALKPEFATVEDFQNISRSLDPIKPIVQNNGVQDKESLLKLCAGHPIPVGPER